MFKINLREIRESKGLKQEDIAKKINVNQVQISKWELNKQIPSLKRTIEIAKALDVTLDELVLYKEAHKKSTEKYIKLKNDKQE